MSGADRERWDTRFAAAGPGEPLPPAALAGRLDLLPAAGRALDLACGRGSVAVWLAGRGLAVDAVDVSGRALRLGAELADREGVDVAWHRADLDAGVPAGLGGGYDVVVCQRFRDPALYPRLVELLVPGGLLAVTVLSEVGDAGGAFRAAPGELLAAFGDTVQVLAHSEGNGQASLVGRRPPDEVTNGDRLRSSPRSSPRATGPRPAERRDREHG